MGFSTLTKSTLFALKTYRLYWPNLISICVLMPITYLVVIFATVPGDIEALKAVLVGYIVMTGFNTLFYMSALYIANTFEEQVLESYVLLPVPFWEVILSTILAQVLVSIPPLVVGLIMLFLVSSTINILLLVAGLAVIPVIYNSLGVLLGAKVRNMIKLNPLLVALMMITIIATPVYYRLLYVSEPYRTLLLLNPLTHVVVVLRASVGVYEGFPVEFSLLYSALISALLLFLTWWKLRGGAFTVLEKR